jgi:predicted nucleic-acid-binding Zn-ribbon protein
MARSYQTSRVVSINFTGNFLRKVVDIQAGV